MTEQTTEFFSEPTAPSEPATPAPQATSAPPQESAPSATSPPEIAPVSPPQMPGHLLRLAESMGVLEEAKTFKDPEALGDALTLLYKQRSQPKAPEVPAPVAPVADELTFPDPDALAKNGFDESIVGMARTMKKLHEKYSKEMEALKELDDLREMKKNLPQIVNEHLHQQRREEEDKRQIAAVAQELGHAASLVDDPKFKNAFVTMAVSQIKALQELGEDVPDLQTIARQVIPLITKRQQTQQKPAPQAARPTPPRDDAGRFKTPPVGAPTHRGSGQNGNALREFLIDSGHDPGPPAPEGVNLGDFLPG